MQSDFVARAQSPWNTGQARSHLSYRGVPKSPPHIFFVLTNLDCLTWGLLSEQVMF